MSAVAGLVDDVRQRAARPPRIALLADTFHEINGAARTCREFQAFARRRRLPFLSVHWGPRPSFSDDGAVRTLELQRSRCSFGVDTDLRFDALFHRKLAAVQDCVERFRPDFVHLTSPGDLGILGAIVAARLRVPLALSWHTSLHEFASRRMLQLMSRLPSGLRRPVAGFVERFVMDRVCWFFGRGQALFAPNPDLVDLLRRRTGKPVFLMGRGVDTALFHPALRSRRDSGLVIGFTGRLMPEKNLRLLVRVAQTLRDAGVPEFRFRFVGEGSERAWLERHLPEAEFNGVLTGERLARAYADMDLFVFPSRTDTFGNVVQEALACGVPAVVTSSGGPRFLVRHWETGLVASTDSDFCAAVLTLAHDQRLRTQMAASAIRQASFQTWDRVFETVYEGYASVLQNA